MPHANTKLSAYGSLQTLLAICGPLCAVAMIAGDGLGAYAPSAPFVAAAVLMGITLVLFDVPGIRGSFLHYREPSELDT